MVELGKRLRQLRRGKDLTQKQLAALVGVTSSVISCYEIGERTPSPPVLRKLAATLNVSTDYLLSGDRSTSFDVSGLDEQDRQVVQMVIDRLRAKNRF